MNVFIVLFIVIILLLVLGLVYLYRRFRSLLMGGKKPEELSDKDRKIKSWLAAIPVAVLVALCVISPYFWIIPILHLLVIWAILEGVFALLRKATSKRVPFWLSGALALVITVAYMSVAFYLAHHVVETKYQVKTNKDVSNLRIALIADAHLGTCFNGEGFAEHMETIQAQKPDLLVICGDFVDDDSSKEDMLIACSALGNFQSTYGVFYVSGNHDRGFGNYRDFTYEEMTDAMAQNGVTVLEDAIVPIGDDYYLVGRKDRSSERMSIETLTLGLDPNRYTIVLNHQPNDYEAEASAKCDLVLSGHTHGGQMIPIGPIGELIGANDATYGLETRNNTTFIVTSGIADWAIPYKSGTVSEYVIIEIEKESVA